ncbi:MAG: lysophospholipid acyltransferase family protein [Planctomycetaceae bacterium]|nr:lysophospholipid acyltransferase family protein [Planctomycetaceae bacterium]
MEYLQSLLLRGSGLFASTCVHHWMSTLDYKAAYYDPTIDPAYPSGNSRKRLYIFWHEYITFMLYLRKRCNLTMLLSRHKDAELLGHVADLFGFDTVRGSSSRGGAEALLGMMSKSKHCHLTITPDGPRGPRRKLSRGCLFLASKLQIPIVMLGLGYNRPWRAPTWDKFAVPRPFSRARAIAGPEIFVPPKLDAEDADRYSTALETTMTRLCELAEDWAVSGDVHLGESMLQLGPLNDLLFYAQPKQAVIQAKRTERRE